MLYEVITICRWINKSFRIIQVVHPIVEILAELTLESHAPSFSNIEFKPKAKRQIQRSYIFIISRRISISSYCVQRNRSYNFV